MKLSLSVRMIDHIDTKITAGRRQMSVLAATSMILPKTGRQTKVREACGSVTSNMDEVLEIVLRKNSYKILTNPQKKRAPGI